MSCVSIYSSYACRHACILCRRVGSLRRMHNFNASRCCMLWVTEMASHIVLCSTMLTFSYQRLLHDFHMRLIFQIDLHRYQTTLQEENLHCNLYFAKWQICLFFYFYRKLSMISNIIKNQKSNGKFAYSFSFIENSQWYLT